MATYLLVHKQTQMRVIHLHHMGACLDAHLRLLPQDRCNRLDEGTARRIGEGRSVRLPHALAEKRRGGQTDLDAAIGHPSERRHLGSHRAGLLGFDLVDDDGPGTSIVTGAQLESMGQLRDDPHIGSSTPLTVGDDIEAGCRLQRGSVGDGRIETLAIGVLIARAAVQNDLAHELRSRHGADNRCGKQGSISFDRRHDLSPFQQGCCLHHP